MSAAAIFDVILFDSVTHCMWAEKLIAKAGVPYKLIPVPKTISADCGVCIRVAHNDTPAAEAAIRGVVAYRGVSAMKTSV